MARTRWAGLLSVATACALIGAAGGIATGGAASKATGSGTSATPSASTGSTSDRPGPGGPGWHGGPPVHSESVELNKAGTAFITVTRDQGIVTAVSGSDITLKEGTKTVTYKTVTVTVASGATVERNDKTAALTDIQTGDNVSIIQSSDGSDVRAYSSDYTPAFPHGGPGHHGGPGGPGFGGPPPGANGSGSGSTGSGSSSSSSSTSSTQSS
jgi:hypothetical protein